MLSHFVHFDNMDRGSLKGALQKGAESWSTDWTRMPWWREVPRSMHWTLHPDWQSPQNSATHYPYCTQSTPWHSGTNASGYLPYLVRSCITHHLCLYCGEPGHLRNACPSRPNIDPVTRVSVTLFALNDDHCLTVPVTLETPSGVVQIPVMIDSGAAGNFMSLNFAQELNISLIRCPSPLAVEAVDGRPLCTGKITHLTSRLMLTTPSSRVDTVLHHPHGTRISYPGASLAPQTQPKYFLVRFSDYQLGRELFLPMYIPG